MATVKTVRLRPDRADWLTAEANRTGISENRIIEALIDLAREEGWQIGARPLTADGP